MIVEIERGLTSPTFDGATWDTTTYAYDAMGNLASKAYSDATPSVAFTSRY